MSADTFAPVALADELFDVYAMLLAHAAHIEQLQIQGKLHSNDQDSLQRQLRVIGVQLVSVATRLSDGPSAHDDEPQALATGGPR